MSVSLRASFDLSPFLSFYLLSVHASKIRSHSLQQEWLQVSQTLVWLSKSGFWAYAWPPDASTELISGRVAEYQDSNQGPVFLLPTEEKEK